METRIDETLLTEYFTRWGTYSAIALFDEKYAHFTTPEVEGCLGYRTTFGHAVVMGNPLCDPHQAPVLIEAFQTFCQQKGWKSVCTAVTSPFIHESHSPYYKNYVDACDEFFLDPAIDPTRGNKGKALRSRVNLAIKKGVTIHEFVCGCPLLEQKLLQVSKQWLDSRNGLQIHLMKADPFSHKKGRRWFYALYKDQIVGLTFIQQAQAHEGWIIPMVMPTKAAPKGTSEYIVVHVLDVLKQENCPRLVLGGVQKERVGEMPNICFMSRLFLKLIYKTSALLFGLQKRRRFWKKFQPEKTSSYLLFQKRRISLLEVFAIFRTLNVSFFSGLRKK